MLISRPKIAFAVPDYVPAELSAIRRSGIDLVLINEEELRERRIKDEMLPTRDEPTEAVLRSPRLPHEVYQYLYGLLQKRNISLINTPEMVKTASEFELHYPLIEQATPRSIVMSANISPTELLEEINRKALKFPVFVKTEIKSLKSGSIIRESNLAEMERVLHSLRTQLSGFYRIIVREMLDLRRLPGDPDIVLEYRAFVMHNSIVTVQDGTEGKTNPPLSSVGRDFYEHWVNELGKVNFSNFYIMDIAMLALKDQFLIIEIKDGQYTKIRNVESFWR
jgi:hypothetical protein